MTLKTQFYEIKGIVRRTTDNILGCVIADSGRPGAQLRRSIGDLNANIGVYVRNGTFARRLLNCFRLATNAGVSLNGWDVVLRGLFKEIPELSTGVTLTTELAPLSVVNNSIILALSQMGRIIAATQYTSRDAVEETMRRMKNWFDKARDMAANEMDSMSYLSLLDLAAAVARFLADVARPLPRMIDYELSPMPALALSQFIYGEGGRSEELAAENRVVHPAFMPRQLRALSA